MPSQRVFTIITIFFVSSLLGLGFIFGRKFISGFTCSYKDQRICRFISQIKREKFENMKGTYTKTTEQSELQATWALSEESSQIVITRGSKNVFEFTEIENNIFLKDMRDQTWWKQSKKNAGDFQSKLPLNPQGHLEDLKNKIVEESTIEVTFIEKSLCEKQVCYRYKLIDPDDANRQINISIDESGNLIKLLTVTDDEEHILTMKYEKNEISEPSPVKVPDTNQNIFLDALSTLNEDKREIPEYLKEFERERQRSEQKDVVISPIQKDSTSPTPTISL